jgi:hypothetical protein
MRAAALICLGAGAGLTGADLRAMRGTDVARRSGGVVAVVRGARPRAVPVPVRYHQPLLESAAFAGSRLICGGRDPGRRNITCPLVTRLARGTGLPAPDASRLRSTWPAGAAALIGPPAFMRAAGITCSQRLGDIIATLDPGGEEHAIALLGGTAR